MFLCSPLRWVTMGARRVMRERSPRATMPSTISWGERDWITRPQEGQWGVPARANNRRR